MSSCPTNILHFRLQSGSILAIDGIQVDGAFLKLTVDLPLRGHLPVASDDPLVGGGILPRLFLVEILKQLYINQIILRGDSSRDILCPPTPNPVRFEHDGFDPLLPQQIGGQNPRKAAADSSGGHCDITRKGWAFPEIGRFSSNGLYRAHLIDRLYKNIADSRPRGTIEQSGLVAVVAAFFVMYRSHAGLYYCFMGPGFLLDFLGMLLRLVHLLLGPASLLQKQLQVLLQRGIPFSAPIHELADLLGRRAYIFQTRDHLDLLIVVLPKGTAPGGIMSDRKQKTFFFMIS